MNRQEIIQLGRKVAAICPAQKFNADTPDAWEALLGWVDYQDALAALFVLGQEQAFIAPADIIRQVKLARRDRLRTHVVPAPADPDDAPGYRAQVRQSTRQAAAPTPVPGRLALTSGLDDVTARRAAQLRSTGGGRLVDPATAPKHSPATVREALAEARRLAREGARSRVPVEPRKRWVPPVDPTPQRGDLQPLSGEVLRDVVDNPPPEPRRSGPDER